MRDCACGFKGLPDPEDTYEPSGLDEFHPDTTTNPDPLRWARNGGHEQHPLDLPDLPPPPPSPQSRKGL